MTSPKRQVITMADVKSARGVLTIGPDAIITPLAVDAAHAHGVRIERATVSPPDREGRAQDPVSGLAGMASRIHHTLLSPVAIGEQIESLCEEALYHSFASVCLAPALVRTAAKVLRGRLPVCSVVGFPTGAHRTAIKAAEAGQCVRDGATEIDMVARHGLLKSGHYQCYADDIAEVRKAVGRGIVLKVIVEAPLLTPEEIVQACALAVHAGADFLKTSTGVYARARTEDVRLMRRACPPHIHIKAAGGIRSLAVIEAGADRIGTSASVAIVTEAGPVRGSR
jgi:deoxyribose-phosphate aldolase